MRLYSSIDMRLTMEDFYAKLAVNCPRQAL
jgi:hypothetical protein